MFAASTRVSRVAASMATKKVQKKKAKATPAGGLSPVVDEDYQGYVFGLYPEWGTYPGSGDEVPGIPFEEAKNAEREVIHGRFAMLGVTGAWAQENLGEGPWFDAGAACTPSACEINYLGQEAFGNTPNAFAIIVVVEILTFGYAEALRTGVVDSAFPELTQGDAYPGGRFDPLNQLGMDNLEELKLKELKHCRLAMFAWLGLIAQAAATKQGPIANWSAHVSDPAAVNIVSVFQNR